MIMLRDPTHYYSGQLSPRADRIAEFISMIGQPIFIPIPVMLLLCTLTQDITEYVMMVALSLLFVAILPIIIVFYFSMRIGRKDGDIPDRTQRYIPMMVGVVSYGIGTAVLYLVNAPKIITVLMLCYTAVTFVMLLITFKWKISIHAVGVIGPTMALAYTFWPWGLLYILWLPPIMWARYVLKKHTPAQLIAGALSGFIITGIIFILCL